MLFAVATPMHMIAPISEGTLKRGLRDEQHPDDAGQRAGQRHQDDERIEPGLEVHRHQEIDQHHGEDQPQPEPVERIRIVSPARAVRAWFLGQLRSQLRP